MSVSLSKGGNVSLSKEAPGLTNILVGLGWDDRSTDIWRVRRTPGSPPQCSHASAGEAHHTGRNILFGVGLVAAYCALSYITKVAKAAVAKTETTTPGEAPVA